MVYRYKELIERFILRFHKLFYAYTMLYRSIVECNSCYTCSWNKPVLNNEGNVSCWRKHRKPLMDFKLKPNRPGLILSLARYVKAFLYLIIVFLKAKLNNGRRKKHTNNKTQVRTKCNIELWNIYWRLNGDNLRNCIYTYMVYVQFQVQPWIYFTLTKHNSKCRNSTLLIS